MAPGYSKPLYLLAFDHRGSFERDVLGAPHPVPDEVRARIIEAKEAAVRQITDHYLETVNGFVV